MVIPESPKERREKQEFREKSHNELMESMEKSQDQYTEMIRWTKRMVIVTGIMASGTVILAIVAVMTIMNLIE